jgi:hypothetical protein
LKIEKGKRKKYRREGNLAAAHQSWPSKPAQHPNPYPSPTYPFIVFFLGIISCSVEQ